MFETFYRVRCLNKRFSFNLFFIYVLYRLHINSICRQTISVLLFFHVFCLIDKCFFLSLSFFMISFFARILLLCFHRIAASIAFKSLLFLSICIPSISIQCNPIDMSKNIQQTNNFLLLLHLVEWQRSKNIEKVCSDYLVFFIAHFSYYASITIFSVGCLLEDIKICRIACLNHRKHVPCFKMIIPNEKTK